MKVSPEPTLELLGQLDEGPVPVPVCEWRRCVTD